MVQLMIGSRVAGSVTETRSSYRVMARLGRPFDPVVAPKDSRELSFEINGKAITEMRFEAERLVERNGGLDLRNFDPAKAIIFRKR